MIHTRPFICCALLTLGSLLTSVAQANITLIATGSLAGTGPDKSGLTGLLENGNTANLLGGLGSGLAWAGGNTFLALPDRGPNASSWNAAVDNTTSYTARFSTMELGLTASNGGSLPFSLSPVVKSTTLLFSDTPLVYAAGAAPANNTANQFYFSGRSDNFDPSKNSLNPNNARLDPEAIRVSKDGKSVFIADEYGPYVYQFDRATGQRINSFALPASFGINNLSAQGAVEISNNASSGRVTNKGMEGLAITPDGKQLVGFMQSPLAQDGGDGGRANRIVTIDIATGQVKQYAYDNRVAGKNYNSSEIVALNDHQFLVLERDGKGLGDGSVAAFKSIYLVDLAGAQDVSNLSGEAALLAKAPAKVLFLDIKAALNAAGISNANIPAKLEALAFGADVNINGVLTHTLYIANDNDFLPTVGGLDNPNQWFVFGVTDADLSSLGASFTAQQFSDIPEPTTHALLLIAMFLMGSRRPGRKHK
jgi:hypothetical protein